MALDKDIRASDHLFQSAGIQVVVDEMSLEYLRGARVDFINDPLRGAGFIVDSPLASTGGSVRLRLPNTAATTTPKKRRNPALAAAVPRGCGGH